MAREEVFAAQRSTEGEKEKKRKEARRKKALRAHAVSRDSPFSSAVARGTWNFLEAECHITVPGVRHPARRNSLRCSARSKMCDACKCISRKFALPRKLQRPRETKTKGNSAMISMICRAQNCPVHVIIGVSTRRT